MTNSTGRRSMVISILLAFIVTFLATPAICEDQKQAPENIQISGKRYNIETSRKMTKIDDVDGHYVAISEYKGVDIKSGVQTFATSLSDTVKGNGTFYGYFKGVMADGGTYYGKSEGKITTDISPSGKPITSSEGTWSVPEFQMAGKHYVGQGTFTTRVIGPGVSSMQYEGEFKLKK